ncbi:MAG: aminopeptidase [Promethearchaeota archaeon]
MTSKIALAIIRDALRVRDQERVWIHTWNHCLELAEEVAQQAQLHGGIVTMSLMTESLLTHALKKAPQEAVITPPTHWLTGIAKSDALIIMDGPEDPSVYKSVEQGKAIHLTNQINQLLDTAFSNRVRTLLVRTTSFTEQAAKIYNLDYGTLIQESNRCVTANQSEILDLGHRIVPLLRKHRDIHLSSREGTDVRFRTQGTPLIDDGIVDQTDVKSKNVLAHYPAGTISIPIDPNSAEGTVAFNWPKAYLGDIVQNLRLDFKKGQAVNLRASKGEQTVERAIFAGTGLKDHLTRLTFGINPNASIPLGLALDELIPGSITLGFGDNRFIGGRSQSNLAYTHSLNDAIVSIGPTAIIMDEKIIL